MNKQEREQFLSKIPDSNIEWVAQVLMQLPAKDRHLLVYHLRKLNEHLYKSWAKDMTLNDIMEAVNIFSEAKTPAKGSGTHTMEPNNKQPDELKKDGEEANAQESAALDDAMGAETEGGAEAAEAVDAEEGGIQG